MLQEISGSHWNVAVVGAGPAGLLAAYEAARRYPRVVLLEKGPKLGVKILMSGGTRCNLTHRTDNRGIVEAFGENGRFLHSALARLSPAEVIALFHRLGVPTQAEPSGKIFPVSNRAVDVRDALVAHLRTTAVKIVTRTAVTNIEQDRGRFQLNLSGRAQRSVASGAGGNGDAMQASSNHSPGLITADKIILTTGGMSYPGCGTVGDGYPWAKNFGHTLVDPIPALAPVLLDDDWPRGLSGIAVEDVRVSVESPQDQRRLEQWRGPFLFTHFGCSGPAAMNVSRAIERHRQQKLKMKIDFAPDINEERLWETAWRMRESLVRERMDVALGTLLQERKMARGIVHSLCQLAGIDPAARVCDIAKKRMRAAVGQIKAASVSIAGTRGFAKAEVTAGGVQLSEVNSSTMESKLRPGLFFAGEILDVDGPIGGYNFQAAFSTGTLAGQSV